MPIGKGYGKSKATPGQEQSPLRGSSPWGYERQPNLTSGVKSRIGHNTVETIRTSAQPKSRKA